MLKESGTLGWELVAGEVVKNDRSWCKRVEFKVTRVPQAAGGGAGEFRSKHGTGSGVWGLICRRGLQ